MHRILVASPKGGGGKTTIGRNLAVAAVHDNLAVASVDLDPQRTLSIWSANRPRDVPAIVHFSIGWQDVDDLLDETEPSPFDVVIIDTPPSIETDPVAFRKLLRAASLVVVPSRATFDDAMSVAPFVRMLDDISCASVIVLNFVKPRANVASVKSYLMKAGELCPVEVGDRTDYARAGARGLGLLDVPRHPGADEISAVWSYVRTRVWGRIGADA